jgi:hypothetical protein
MELIALSFTIIGTVIAGVTYLQTVRGKAKEKRKYLLDEYYFIKDLNIQIVDELNNYVIKNKCAYHKFLDEETFFDVIERLNGLEKMLSSPEIENALKKSLKNLSGTEITIDNLTKDIEYWQAALFAIQAALNKLNK